MGAGAPDNAGVIIKRDNIEKIRLIEDKKKIHETFNWNESLPREIDKLIEFIGRDFFLSNNHNQLIELHLKKIKIKDYYKKEETREKKDFVLIFSVDNGKEIIKRLNIK